MGNNTTAPGFLAHPLTAVIMTAVLTALIGSAVTVATLQERISVLTERVNLVTGQNAKAIDALSLRFDRLESRALTRGVQP